MGPDPPAGVGVGWAGNIPLASELEFWSHTDQADICVTSGESDQACTPQFPCGETGVGAGLAVLSSARSAP